MTTKAWANTKGVFRPGRPISKQNLFKALRNPIYIGQIRHKGKLYPGLHTPIIDQDLWDKVHGILAEEATGRRVATVTRNSPTALLRGLLFAPNGDRMIPTFTRKATGKGINHYRHYPASTPPMPA